MIWANCNGPAHIAPISGTLCRLVESQEQIATLGYVDTLEEQALLEELLETVKPPLPEETNELHYLLKTPFRYPPLKWGSRFGRTHENGIFYGGKSVETTLAECAYYRFIFWYSMDAVPVKDKIRTEHTLFSATYHSKKGIQLHKEPFRQYYSVLRHPGDYLQTQLLGSDMREAGVEVFEYESARDPGHGICIGLFTARAFFGRQPENKNQWLCELTEKTVIFKQLSQNVIHRFLLDDFLYKGKLPFPA